MSKQYYPSNSSDGDYFMNQHCNHCTNHDPDDGKHTKSCPILIKSLFEPVIEWIYENDKPICTGYKYHDWSEGEPEIINPNQLELFNKEEKQ